MLLLKKTDDVGVFCSPISNEFYLVGEHFELTKQDLWNLSRNAVCAIFAGEEVKDILRTMLNDFVGTGMEGNFVGSG